MTIQQRKKILELLHEQRAQGPLPLLSRKGISQKMALQWSDIELEMDFLREKGYVHVETTTIGAQNFEWFKITSTGIDLLEGRDNPSVLTGSAGKIVVLFLAADPTDVSRLRHGEESREIREKLQLAKLRDRFDLQQRLAVRPGDLAQALLDIEPQVVHFSGHGTTTGALCFEDEVGLAHLIPPDVLAALFKQFTQHVRCVVLNACYAELQARAIVSSINYVIGMNKAISDRAAIVFASGFYRALGAGRSFEDAYNLGCIEIRLHEPDSPEHLTPVLLKQA